MDIMYLNGKPVLQVSDVEKRFQNAILLAKKQSGIME